MLFGIGNNKNNTNKYSLPQRKPSKRLGIPLPPKIKTNTHYNIPKSEEKPYWGPPTWILFHSLAEKIKDEHFNTIKTELCNYILKVCLQLPCPICAKHAREYMKSVNFNNITTKQSLKKMLFDFHNAVNDRKNYSKFTMSELESTYSKSDLIPVFNNFLKNYHTNGMVRYMSETITRNELKKQFSGWFKKNMHCFVV